MALTDVAICSRALVLLGEVPISSLEDEESDPARICGQIYPGLRDSTLSAYGWRFALALRSLTREAGTPDSAWNYSFVLPSDRASSGGMAAYPDDAVGTPPFTEWSIIGRRLYANVEAIWLEYPRTVSEADFPFYFADFLEAALASRIAFAITDQQNTAKHWHEIAYGPDPDVPGGRLLLAMQLDAQQFPSRNFDVAANYDLITARFG